MFRLYIYRLHVMLLMHLYVMHYLMLPVQCLQYFDTVGWVAARAFGLRKNLSGEVLVWLSVWNEVQMICILSS